MSNHAKNKELAKTRTTQPSKTDQSGTKETDINVIVGRFLKTGMGTINPKEPMSDIDLTNVPTDLRSAIHTARMFNKHKASLPPGLRDKPLEELLALTTEQINTILAPPAPPPEPKKEEIK